jgi:hypothetical protein
MSARSSLPPLLESSFATGVANDRPTPLGIGVVEELIARTSPRRIVDDPGSAAFPDPAVRRQHWQDLSRLSARARGELLLRLFGRCPATIRMDVSDNQDGCRCGVRAKVGRSPTVG